MNSLDHIDADLDVGTKIHLYFTIFGVPQEKLKDRRTVVIDVLRTATSIVHALKNGAKYVIPAESASAAGNLASQIPRDDVLLCGERDSRIIDGFDLGNSPAEYRRERVDGRRIIFASTNGTPAVVRASNARSVFLAGFVNLDAVIDAILDLEDPFPRMLLCSGNSNKLSLEDSVCGGLLIKRLRERGRFDFELNDGAMVAELLAERFGDDKLKLLNECDHGRFLKTLGLEDDLKTCARDSIFKIVPVLDDGRLVILEK